MKIPPKQMFLLNMMPKNHFTLTFQWKKQFQQDIHPENVSMNIQTKEGEESKEGRWKEKS